MSQKLFQLKDVLPNPFRDMKSYPIREDKIEALTASFERTGYWGNIVGRMKGDKVEIAYGHHRLVAMRKSMKKTDEVAIIVKQVSDEDMLRMMADENMQEWGSNSVIEQETIRSVVLAYAAGKIELEKPQRIDAFTRYAPGFRKVSNKDLITNYPYSDLTIAKFLAKGITGKLGHGWFYIVKQNGKPIDQASPRVRNALEILEMAEDTGAEKEFTDMTRGLGSDQAKAVAGVVRRVRKGWKDEGKEKVGIKRGIEAGKKAAESLRKANDGVPKTGTRHLDDIERSFKPEKGDNIPNIEEFVNRFIDKIKGVLKDDELRRRWNAVKEWIEYVDDKQVKRLGQVLLELSNRCQLYKDELDKECVGSKVPLLKHDGK